MALAVSTNSINLGQGFPDTDDPKQVAEAAIKAIRDGHNQYPPGLKLKLYVLLFQTIKSFME